MMDDPSDRACTGSEITRVSVGAEGNDAMDELKRILDLDSGIDQDLNGVDQQFGTEKDRELLGFVDSDTWRQRGYPDSETICTHLAASLWERWEESENEAMLAACVEVEAQLLNLRPCPHPDRAKSCINLALSLKTLFDQTGDNDLLNAAIDLNREVLDMHPTGHPSRATSCRGLALSLKRRFYQTNDTQLLAEIIGYEREALDLHVAGHPDRVESCENLAASLWSYFDHTEEDALLDEAIDLQREALQLRPAGHPHRAVLCSNLASALKTRFDRCGDHSLLDEAIDLEREVLSLHPNGHPDRVELCGSLALSIKKRFRQTGGILHLEEAVQLDREALSLCPPGHSDRAISCANLASSLTEQFEQVGDWTLLVNAIDFEREALRLRPIGHPDRVLSCGNLAVSLKIRFNHTGGRELLDESVELEREALELCPVGHGNRAMACGNLASSLVLRYNQAGDIILLDEAIKLEREVHSLQLVGDPRRDNSCTNLAVALKKRYNHTGDVELLNEIVDLEQKVLCLRPDGHPERASACGNLAFSLGTCFELTGDASLLDSAIELCQESLNLRPTPHPDRAAACMGLATLLRRRLEAPGDGDPSHDIYDSACGLLAEALSLHVPGHPQRWRCFQEMADLALLRHKWTTAMENLSQVLNSATYDDINEALCNTVEIIDRIDVNAISHSEKEAFLQLYFDAIGLMTLATGVALDISTQLQHIHNGMRLASGAFLLATRVNNLSTGLQLLERARGVIWLQVLQTRDPQLDDVPVELADKLRKLLKHATTPSQASRQASPSPKRDLLYMQRNQIQEAIRQIRLLPELGDFMRGPDAQSLLSAAARGYVVVLVVGKDELHALVIESTDRPLVDLVLPGMNQQIFQDLTFVGPTTQKRGSSSEMERGISVSKSASRSHARLAKLWRYVVKPIITHLGLVKAKGRVRPRIHWCSTGTLAFVPVHAAGLYDGASQECCSDYFVSSYTPTLTALVRAQQGKCAFAREQVRLLAVAVEHAQDPAMPPLCHVAQEAREIVNAATKAGARSSLDASARTKAEVRTMLESATVVHLACHGIQHESEPHKSHFCLEDGRLSVSELMEMDFKHAFLAFLSACETAKGDFKHADEAVHLAASMLFAGFKSVVATMWAMSDADGPYVAKRFYGKLFEDEAIDVDSVPYALDDAVTALRRTGAPPERWATFVHMGA